MFELLRSDTLGHAIRENPGKLSEYYNKLDLLCAVSLTLVPGGSEWAMKIAPIKMDKHLRGVVIPNANTIYNLYKAL